MERHIRFVQSTLIADVHLTQISLGDIIYIYKFGNPVIVLNSAEAANILLDKRGHKYSSRPPRTMLTDV
jgi:hypothetical protein